jgi:hypothetical protein
MCAGCGNWDEAFSQRVIAEKQPGDVLISASGDEAETFVRDGYVADGERLGCEELGFGLVRCR